MTSIKVYVVGLKFLGQYVGVAITQSGRVIKVSERPGRLSQMQFFMGCNGSTRCHEMYRAACRSDEVQVDYVEELPAQVILNFENREKEYEEAHTGQWMPGGFKVNG